ncbi:hypothetical protein [Marinobacter sp. MDS2]|uniref:hypothetical protein n=1 Tax=Marinobacter sp. MDS2 TaxID=3065961 RepID=UPI00273AA6DF|nr:hypothetical protein [Marinobacter sp. MDS2]MDP4546508.1 hypothetical protein [Marinobacter sp. MDS2]
MNEVLMQAILRELNRGPMSLAGLALALGRYPKDVRPELGELVRLEKVTLHADGRRYVRTDRRTQPSPTGPEAA